MSSTRFTKEHEYVRREGELGTVGITDYAQSQLGDIVFVELPEVGKTLAKGGEAAVIESVKVASDLYTPVTGEVVAVNKALQETPALVNEDPVGQGWFFQVRLADPAELDGLMDETAYAEFVKTL
jgi:glycine cleavage system H protein